MLAVLLSCQMINDDLVGMENNLEVFLRLSPQKPVTPAMQFYPILASNVLPVVVRGSVALWLWCPHLLIDMDCLARRSTLASNTHTLPCSPPHAHSHSVRLTNTIHSVMHSHPHVPRTLPMHTRIHILCHKH